MAMLISSRSLPAVACGSAGCSVSSLNSETSKCGFPSSLGAATGIGNFEQFNLTVSGLAKPCETCLF